MKKTLHGILAVAMMALVAGCSQQSEPTDVVVAPAQAPNFIKLPKRLTPSLQKTVTVTQFITAAQGGTLRLIDTYRAAPDSHIVTLDIALVFGPGDLPYDASLSMSVDDVAFITTVGLTFAPHGIVFNHPATLSVQASGLTLDAGPVAMRLYYLNEQSVWERMPASNAIYRAGSIDAHGRLPHFSQYAFGRVTEN